MAASGDAVVVGAYGKAIASANQAGAAYVFVKPAEHWQSMTQSQKLQASDSAAEDWFGYSTALDGNTALVGVPKKDFVGFPDAGCVDVFVFEDIPSPTPTQTPLPTDTPKPGYNINTKENFPDPDFRAVAEEFMGVEPEGPFTNLEAAAAEGILDCANRMITETAGLQFFPKITGFWGTNNHIVNIDFSNNPLLDFVDLSYNNLSDVSYLANHNHFGPKTTLDLRYNVLNVNSPAIAALQQQVGELRVIPQLSEPQTGWYYVVDESIEPHPIHELIESPPAYKKEIVLEPRFQGFFGDILGMWTVTVYYDASFNGGDEWFDDASIYLSGWQDTWKTTGGELMTGDDRYDLDVSFLDYATVGLGYGEASINLNGFLKAEAYSKKIKIINDPQPIDLTVGIRGEGHINEQQEYNFESYLIDTRMDQYKQWSPYNWGGDT